MPSASDRIDFAPPSGNGGVRAFVLALMVHALLIAALTWGVNWKRSDTSTSYEAELWSAVPRQAAPRLAETPSEPTPEVVKPPPAPVSPPPAPPAPEKPEVKAPPPPPVPDVDIALEQEKKRKQLALQKQAEVKKEAAKAIEKDKAIALAKKQKERKAEEEQTRKLAQAEAVKEEKEAAREAARQEAREAAKVAAKEAAKEAKEAQKLQAQKLAQQLAKQQEQGKQAQAASQKQREENLDRLRGMAGANGSANDTGTALKSSGPSASYGGVLRAAIRPNVVFTEEIVGNPMATVEVRVTSDGTIISQRLVKSSGNKNWDDAAVNAIIRTRIMPRDVDGRMPDTILLIDMRARG